MKNSYRFFENRDCAYFPCHEGLTELNCLFCYCPFYGQEKCPGTPKYKAKGERMVKICTDCVFPHRPEHYDKMISLMKEI